MNLSSVSRWTRWPTGVQWSSGPEGFDLESLPHGHEVPVPQAHNTQMFNDMKNEKYRKNVKRNKVGTENKWKFCKASF